MSAYRRLQWIWSLCLLVGSLVATLIVFEVALRLLDPQILSGSWMYVDPDGNMLNRKDGVVRHQIGERAVYYRFNSLHGRGHEPPPDAMKVLTLGDSFTFGWGLGEEDGYVARLQAKADRLALRPPVYFVNPSVGGWGTADQYLYLHTYGEALRPIGVVMFVSIDDFGRARRHRAFTFDPATAELIERPISSGAPWVKRHLQESRTYNWLLEHSHLVQLGRNAVVFGMGVGRVNAPEAGRAGPSQREAERKIAAAFFAKIQRWCADHGARLIVLTNGWPDVRYPWLKEEMSRLGIPFFDLYEPVAGASAPIFETTQSSATNTQMNAAPS